MREPHTDRTEHTPSSYHGRLWKNSMDKKVVLGSIIGFILGGLVVAIAAAVMDNPQGSPDSMSAMTASLKDKKGDTYDKEFLSAMIAHHQNALDMVASSPDNAKHEALKKLSRNITESQAKEIHQMKQWQIEWGYSGGSDASHMH